MTRRPRRLTEQQAQEIRDWYRARMEMPSAADISRKFGVSESTVWHIGRERIYKRHA